MTSPHQHGAEGAVLTTTSQCEFRAQASSGLPLWAKLFAFHNFQYIIYQSPLSSFGGRFSPSVAHNPALPAPNSTLARGGRAARPCAIQSEIQVSGREEGSLAALLDEKGGAGLLQGTCHANVCRRMDEPRHAFFAHLLGVCECCTVSLASVRALSVGISGWRA